MENGKVDIIHDFLLFIRQANRILIKYKHDYSNIKGGHLMRTKKTIFFACAILFLFSISSLSAARNLYQVGRHPFVKGGTPTVAALKEAFTAQSEELRVGFEKVGLGHVYPAFMTAVNDGAISEDIMPKGQAIRWMMFKQSNKVQIVKDIVWAANKTLDVFAINARHECRDYKFIIPQACGNVGYIDDQDSVPICDVKVSSEKVNINDPVTIDLSGSKCAQTMKVRIVDESGAVLEEKELSIGNAEFVLKLKEPGIYKVKAEVFNQEGVASTNDCVAEILVNYPPECALSVKPKRVFAGKTVTMDASASSDKDGKVVKADFSVMSESGDVIEKHSVTEQPFKWERICSTPGKYTVKLVVSDDFNAQSSNSCEQQFEVQKLLYWVADGFLGLTRGSHGSSLGARFGLAYFLVPETLDVMATVGGAFNMTGEPFYHYFLSNLQLNLHLDAFSIGGGIGISSKLRNNYNSDLDIVLNLAYDLFRKTNSIGSLFAELRIPIGEGLEFSHEHQIHLGYRLKF